MKENIVLRLIETYRGIADAVDGNEVYFIASTGSVNRGLSREGSDLDISGVFIESAKNRRSFITTARNYNLPDFNVGLIEIKQFFNHLIFAKPTAYEMLTSANTSVSNVRDIETLKQRVFGYRDKKALYYQYSKMAYGSLTDSQSNDKQLIRGIYHYLLAEASYINTEGFCSPHYLDLLEILHNHLPEELMAGIVFIFELYLRGEPINDELRKSVAKQIIKSRRKVMDEYVEKPNKDLHKYLTSYMKANFY